MSSPDDTEAFRNLEFFFAAYSVIVVALCALFGYLLLRVRKLGAEVEALKRDQDSREAS